jgi:hypothetical protein
MEGIFNYRQSGVCVGGRGPHDWWAGGHVGGQMWVLTFSVMYVWQMIQVMIRIDAGELVRNQVRSGGACKPACGTQFSVLKAHTLKLFNAQ